MEEDCNVLKDILKGLKENPDIDILTPFGTLLPDVPLAKDDIDESLIFPTCEANLVLNANSGSGLDRQWHG